MRLVRCKQSMTHGFHIIYYSVYCVQLLSWRWIVLFRDELIWLRLGAPAPQTRKTTSSNEINESIPTTNESMTSSLHSKSWIHVGCLNAQSVGNNYWASYQNINWTCSLCEKRSTKPVMCPWPWSLPVLKDRSSSPWPWTPSPWPWSWPWTPSPWPWPWYPSPWPWPWYPSPW